MTVRPEDLHAQPYFDDPFPVWERLRHDQPLFHDTVDDRWLLTRYDDVAAVFRDHETYSTKPYERIFTDVIGPTMVQMDGDDHDVRRSIVAPVLVGRKLETNYVPLIDTVVDDLLDRLPTTGSIDLMAGLTMPLPLKVIATILGMGADDDAYLAEVTAKVIAALAGEEPARSDGIATHARFTAHIDTLIEARSQAPGPDLISGIAHGRTEAGERLSRQEIASFIALMMVAGGETTDRGLANFIAILLEHPDVLAAVRADPALIDPAFSEFMRRDGVVVYEDRELRRDVEWYGTAIPAGATVRVALDLGEQRRDRLRRPAPIRPDPAGPAPRQGESGRRPHRRRGEPPRVRAGQAFLHRLPAGPRRDRDSDARTPRADAGPAFRRRTGAAAADRLVPSPPRPPGRRGVVAAGGARAAGATGRRTPRPSVEPVLPDHRLVHLDAQAGPGRRGDPAVRAGRSGS